MAPNQLHRATGARLFRRLLLALFASLSAAAGGADLEYCAGRPEYPAVFEQSAEMLPSVDLTSVVRESVTAAHEESESRQAALERSRSRGTERRDAESESIAYSYSVSAEDARALTVLVAAQPRKTSPASIDLIAQAAQIGVEAAGVEAARLIAAGTSPAEAKRSGQQHGIAFAKTALHRAGATLGPADAEKLAARIAGDIEAGTATAGVAPWARSTTQKVASSRTRERSSRTESSTSESTSDQSRISATRQQSRSRADQLANERSLTVPIRIDWNRDVLVTFFPGRASMPNGGQPYRIAALSCAEQTRIMAQAAFAALGYAEARESDVAEVVRQVNEVARTGNLFLFAAAVTSLLDDSRPAARAAALFMIYHMGSVRITGRLGGVSSTVLQQDRLSAIQRQFTLLDEIVTQQLAEQGRTPGIERSEPMPPLVGPPKYSSMAPTPPEQQMFLYVQMMREEYVRMQRSGAVR